MAWKVASLREAGTHIMGRDGNRIELVQWPAGHADGINASDWAE
ncbi:MAG: hypothetical protein ACR2GF_06210 [Acidimicrobiales bacterium]